MRVGRIAVWIKDAGDIHEAAITSTQCENSVKEQRTVSVKLALTAWVFVCHVATPTYLYII